jgi:TRAP-type mannitol/chloroaromatic compound transport system permease large subunit
MENRSLSKNTYSFGVSLAVCAVLNAAVVIAKESSKIVADRMQKMTGHHWTTHVLFMVAVFVALGWALNRRSSQADALMSSTTLVRTVVGGVLAGIVIIFGFYLFAD